ncbi:MAG: cell wall-active antibiotics response protein [Bacteroidetes bacterium]|nr:cell wall-active antibiotics response protein [Bacteroidota bacterium]MBU1373714.1 cell wall-active antibiotics response protein [Bacteroidota bacterium]MBU1485198.1 cell wall-active antibiotics response protein [Bacteroidota bacterium]MBU1761657.1 cell wall-active antibiotics response protein [Bacteroidota bacterium]MBU2047211.1 cell wall-active antibiotics response protein [Bacteroidota bacterium]
MENQNVKKTSNANGKKVVGAAILVIGLALLAKQMELGFPDWVFSWPMILIVIGIASGIKHQFKNATWFILILIGGIFLLERIIPALSVSQFTWPIVFIGIGLWFIFGRGFNNDGNCRKGRRRWRDFDTSGFQTYAGTTESETLKNDEPVAEENGYHTMGDEYLDSVSIFGGTKKNILSKNFKGGEIVTIMGGAEINLIHSDIKGVVVLDVVQIFGGTKILIPPTWDVTSEMAAIFGGIDDKRSLTQVLPDRSKILVIKGTSIFGGIEIRNF